MYNGQVPGDPSTSQQAAPQLGTGRPPWSARGGGPRELHATYAAPSTAVSTTAGEAEIDTKIAAGRAVQILMLFEQKGECNVSASSVYGAAMAMPQIARSAGWSRTWTALAVRAFVHLFLNYAMQYTVLYQIALKENCMNYYSGKMHLCNFGLSYDQCQAQDGLSDCVGPGGTNYTKAGIYSSYTTWSTRKFFKDALLNTFPERAGDIEKNLQVGEFGIESPVCRVFCVFIFLMYIVDDLTESLNMLRLLWRVPSSPDSWLTYEPPSWTEDKQRAKDMFGQTEMDYVKFSVAGMPLGWKILDLFFIVIPKIFLWLMLAVNGFQFLMETGGINALILNSLAMTFILNIDELLASRLCTAATKETMRKLEPYKMYTEELAEQEQYEDQKVLEEFDAKDGTWKVTDHAMLHLLLPKRLLYIVSLTACFYAWYYVRFCHKTPDGSWVSQPIYPPKEIQRFGGFFIKWLFHPSGIERVDTPTWTMPGLNVQDNLPFSQMYGGIFR